MARAQPFNSIETREMKNSANELFKIAQRYLPGGVCASARFNSAIGRPFFVSRGDGSRVYDLDGCEYIEVSWCVGCNSGYYSLTHKGNSKYSLERIENTNIKK